VGAHGLCNSSKPPDWLSSLVTSRSHPFSRELLFNLYRRLSLLVHRRSLSYCFIHSFLAVIIVLPHQRNTNPSFRLFFSCATHPGQSNLSSVSLSAHNTWPSLFITSLFSSQNNVTICALRKASGSTFSRRIIAAK
jgi:hypothetical protein